MKLEAKAKPSTISIFFEVVTRNHRSTTITISFIVVTAHHRHYWSANYQWNPLSSSSLANHHRYVSKQNPTPPLLMGASFYIIVYLMRFLTLSVQSNPKDLTFQGFVFVWVLREGHSR